MCVAAIVLDARDGVWAIQVRGQAKSHEALQGVLGMSVEPSLAVAKLLGSHIKTRLVAVVVIALLDDGSQSQFTASRCLDTLPVGRPEKRLGSTLRA